MIRLDTTTRKLQIVLAGAVAANQLPVTVCYSDKSATTYNGATAECATNGATAVDICAAPGAGVVRDVDMIAVVNVDTAAVTVTIRLNDNATLVPMFRATLAAGDQINYTHAGGFRVLDSTGAAKGSGSASSSGKTTYSQSFPANVWGGRRHSFTVPAGVSKLKATATAPGGCLNGAGSMGALASNPNNLIFARINGVDPFFMVTADSSSTYMALNILGTQVTGTVANDAIAGVNGAGDMLVGGRMHGNYFNAADAVPWGISVSQSNGANSSLVISSTTDGFSFTHAKVGSGLASSPSTSFWIASVVFGGAGEAIVVPGNSSYFYYTSNYGATWTTIANSTALAGANATRLRYLNGTWVMLTNTPTFYYTSAPAAGAWTSKAPGSRLYDIGWTGTTYVGAHADAANVYICATLGGTWTLQAHGGNLAFDAVESGNGEVLLFQGGGASCTGAASMRATSGAATSWVAVSPYSAGATYYDAAKYIPFASGGMWVIGSNTGTTMYSRASLLSGVATAFPTAAPITGNVLNNGTAINNVQWCGGNYVHLSANNGLGKYSAAGVITTSLQTSAQLTAEFGFSASTVRSSSLTITRGSTTLLSLQGGGTGATNAGPGGGAGYPSPGTGRGCGPAGNGGLSATTSGIAQLPSGTGGFGALVSGSQVANGGGAVPNLWGGLGLAPLPNTKVPGASGGGSLFATNPGCGGGGGSLFAPAGNGYVPSNYLYPATVFAASSRIGSPGGGAHGAWVGSTTCYSAAGGGEGCYRYEIDVTPGDVLEINVPGVAYVYASSTATIGGPGGEGYCLLEWEV